jgi:DNA-binding CsgD family transcriptional regulator
MARSIPSRAANKPSAGRQTAALAIILVIQGVAAVFFVGDAMGDFRSAPLAPHTLLEGFVALALVSGIGFAAWELRRTLARMEAQERALDMARGAMAQVIDRQFADWGLTPAECDVGMLALKGLDVAEIAAIRGAAQGTVRAQLTRIYAKADVTGRAQFAAWFVEDLLQDPVA